MLWDCLVRECDYSITSYNENVDYKICSWDYHGSFKGLQNSNETRSRNTCVRNSGVFFSRRWSREQAPVAWPCEKLNLGKLQSDVWWYHKTDIINLTVCHLLLSAVFLCMLNRMSNLCFARNDHHQWSYADHGRIQLLPCLHWGCWVVWKQCAL